MKKANTRVKKSAGSVFNHQTKNLEGINMQLIKQARKNGQLNLSNRSLVEVPDVVCHINSFTPEEKKSLSMDINSKEEDRWWDQVELKKLILAFNSLQTIPSSIEALSSLNILDLHDNQLDSLPTTFKELKYLTKLNLSHNKFQEIPETIFHLKDLKYLHLQKNKFQNVNDEIGNLCNLEELDLSHNEINTLPQSIGFLTRIFKFNVSHNNLREIPEEINSMLAIRILELSNNNLENLPSSLSCLENLEMLYAMHNKIKKFPMLSNTMCLKEMHFGNNALSEITKEHIDALPQLCLLDLRDNKISSIPDEIVNVFSLERFDISNNNLKSLPFSLGLLPNLKALQIEGNSLRSIRRDIVMRGTTHLLKWLRSRIEDPSKYNVSTESKRSRSSSSDKRKSNTDSRVDIYSMKASKTFDQSNSKLDAIPPELFSMAKEANISIINFSKNYLTEIPNELESFTTKLTEVNLGFNKISAIPSFMSSCSHLMYLDLRNNALSELPDQLSNLNRLREICLSFNRFSSIPCCIYNMEKLEIIILNDNKIENIDVDGLSKLKLLATLDLSNNSVKRLPPALGNMEQLKSLQLEGNIFRYPRHNILAKGTPTVLQFLRNQLAQ